MLAELLLHVLLVSRDRHVVHVLQSHPIRLAQHTVQDRVWKDYQMFQVKSVIFGVHKQNLQIQIQAPSALVGCPSHIA